ncbi:hypothetical protein [Bradyrhizobium sp. USDA 4486]
MVYVNSAFMALFGYSSEEARAAGPASSCRLSHRPRRERGVRGWLRRSAAGTCRTACSRRPPRRPVR